jgi:hypothetical protein
MQGDDPRGDLAAAARRSFLASDPGNFPRCDNLRRNIKPGQQAHDPPRKGFEPSLRLAIPERSL